MKLGGRDRGEGENREACPLGQGKDRSVPRQPDGSRVSLAEMQIRTQTVKMVSSLSAKCTFPIK